jgi:hypothetical protein
LRQKTHVVAFFIFACLTPVGAIAQGAALIRGRVIDTVGVPVRDAEALLLGTPHRSLTNGEGVFTLREVDAGVYRLLVRSVGFAPVYLNAKIFGSDTVDADVVLHRAMVGLDTVHTVAPQRRANLVEFELNRKLGLGKFFSREDLDRLTGSTLRTVLPMKIVGFDYVPRPCHGVGLANSTPIMRLDLKTNPVVGVIDGCIMPDLCYAQLYVDGVRIFFTDHRTEPPNIEDYPLEQLEAVEIYARSSETPARFNTRGAVCGTLALWLRR